MKAASRRTFLIAGIGAASALALRRPAFAAEPQRLGESDPQAQAQGYKLDASKVDAARFPEYKAGQNCANCSLYSGGATDAFGGCVLFGDKLVAAKGWCKAYTNA
ncbi:MAG TPA: high-potential iron-sulfur protein [Trinickia sp.]|jgi:hypothetical protein|nr:high-potential iron-sulfur protein [Trinickia sp.]